MATLWSKLDNELQVIFSNYLEIQEKGKTEVRWIHPGIRETYLLSVKLEYSGSLQSIESLGFQVTHRIDGSTVRGRLLLDDLERIAASDQVINLSFGQQGRPLLDQSVANINARGTKSEDSVWQIDRSKGQFSGKTGKGVVVGIIDTGIDYNHPVFSSSDDPKTTRIKRIWDQGVHPHDGVKSPSNESIGGGDQYGAEYTDAMINSVIRGETSDSSIKHKDCDGHGTHVASTAVGNGRAKKVGAPDSSWDFIGVAPNAEIVVVKILYLFNLPRTEPEPGEQYGALIGYDQQFEDAVTYILNYAQSDEHNIKPVVINYSIGNSHGPHDGFTKQERWLTAKFGTTNSKGLFVAAAGNSSGDKIYALATIQGDPGGQGEVVIPFKLYDNRDLKTAYSRCEVEDDTSDLYVDMWYKNIAGAPITPRLTLPDGKELPELALSAEIQHGDLSHSGSPLYYTFIHSTETITRPMDGEDTETVMRNNINLCLKHNIRGDFKKGTYSIKLTGPVGAEVHIWADIDFGTGPKSKKYGIKFDEDKPLDGIDIKKGNAEEHLICSPAGADNILAVASYLNRKKGPISKFSSRGPLVNYSSAPEAHIQKPDIAAPGEIVEAADSSHSTPPGKSPCCQNSSPPDYVARQGTSMASPHVAGVAALILEKNKTLLTRELIELIKDNVQDTDGDDLNKNHFGVGRIDAKEAFDNA